MESRLDSCWESRWALKKEQHWDCHLGWNLVGSSEYCLGLGLGSPMVRCWGMPKEQWLDRYWVCR